MGVYKVNQTTGELDLIAGGTLYADAPVGAIISYGGSTAPSGWLLCQGQAVSRTTYAALFAAIGTAFGNGDGSTTFNLPDLREATTKGAGLSGKSSNHYDSDGVALGEFVEDRIQNLTGNADIGGFSGKATSSSGAFLEKTLTSGQSLSPITDANMDLVTLQFDASRIARTGATTEVKAVGVNYIIKAVQSAVPVDITAGVEDMLDEVKAVIPSEASASNKVVVNSDLTPTSTTVTLSISDNTDDDVTLRLSKSGNVVTASYFNTRIDTGTLKTNWTSIGTIPTGYRPVNTVFATVNHSNSRNVTVGLQFFSTGAIMQYKYTEGNLGYERSINLTWITA